MLDVAEDVSSGKIDTGFILDKFEKSCNINLKSDIGLDLFNNFDTVIDDLNSEHPVIPSTWKWLDDKIDGGFLQNGRALYIFAGETNVGKSIFLGNIASNIAKQGKTVLIITLEMSELIYAKRLSSNITKIPVRDLKVESVTSRGIKLDAIVLDYINLVKSTIGNNSYERVKYATEQVRALSYVFSCPFITATQLNRTGYNTNNPGLETIGESIGLAATADVIVSIFQDDEDKELGVVKMAMMKNRFGMNHGVTTMKMDYATLTVTEDDSLSNQGDQSSITKTLAMLSNKG